jgi:hypothetical protein
MDKLEEHIRKNREDLDRYSPSKAVWKNINRQINRKQFPIRRFLSAAAMIVVIVSTTFLLVKSGLLNRNYSGAGNTVSGNNQENAQIRETEIYYNNLVNSLYREAKPMLTGNPEISKELSTDISHIDSICIEIKKDLKDNVANQDVVEALIQNYRIKIRLLEDMLTILKENDKDPEKEKNHEL